MSITLISILATSFVVMLVSLSGVFFSSRFLKDWTERNMKYLIAFASGVFLVIAYNLVNEALEFAHDTKATTFAIIFGFLIFYFIEKLFPETHCHHDDTHCLVENTKKSANRVMLGDSFHNAGDGVLLATVFVVDIRLGFLATIGVIAHEFVQEIAEYFILKSAGYSTKEALTRNFISASTILIGAIGGYYISSFEELVGPLIGFSAGVFIYILTTDLIPESFRHSHQNKKYLQYFIWVFVGALLILVTESVTGYFLQKEGLDPHGHADEYRDEELNIPEYHDEYIEDGEMPELI